MTALCVGTYALFRMAPFDALCHGMTTVATGGFANYDASFGAFGGQAALLLTACLFMLASALPFSLYLRGVRSALRNLHPGPAGTTFFLLIILFYGAFVLLLKLGGGPSADSSWLWILFNTVSILTTTGYAVSDYNSWGQTAVMLFFFALFIARAPALRAQHESVSPPAGLCGPCQSARRLVHPWALPGTL